MAELTWREQYNHPLWQKKRLEAMEDAGFQCANCRDKETQLHVHHKRYVKGRKMWEYDLAELIVLCAPCHEEYHYLKDQIADVFVRAPQETHAELLQICRGYVNTSSGPFFGAGDDYVRPKDRYYYRIGVLTGASSMLGANLAEVMHLLAAKLRSSVPMATALHRDIEDGATWFEQHGDDHVNQER